MKLKCQDLLQALGDYIDGDIDPELCETFRKHMENCHRCEVVVDNLRRTITVYKAGEPVEMPAELHDQLHGLLRKNWEAKFPAT